jgi:hypothetical protein
MFESAKYYAPQCNIFKVIDTQYYGSSGGKWWQEIWIIDACGTKWKGKIKFHPDGTVASSVGLEQVK